MCVENGSVSDSYFIDFIKFRNSETVLQIDNPQYFQLFIWICEPKLFIICAVCLVCLNQCVMIVRKNEKTMVI